MTSGQLVTFAKKCVGIWRKRLRIDSKWSIDVTYSSEPDANDQDTKCIMNDDKAQYWQMRLTFYPPVLNTWKADSTVRDYVNHTVCHELRHIFYWPISSFAQNALPARLWNEYLKHEEQVVTLDEEIFTNQRPKQGVKLKWEDQK